MQNSNSKSILTVVKEMFGRSEPITNWMKSGLRYNIFNDSPSVDYTKTNYFLSRAIFYASVVTDAGKNKKYGKDFLFGAAFGKPIVNSAAAFAFADDPEITLVKETLTADTTITDNTGDEKATDKLLKDWQEEYSSEVFKTVRNSLRDGDQYIWIQNDLKAVIIPPEQIEIVDDPITGEITGYDMTTFIDEDDGSGDRKETIKYVAEFRKTSPHYVEKRYDNGSDSFKILKEETHEEPDGKMLPIFPFHNERDARERYGVSEFQNCYYLMANYHAVLENAIKGDIYDNTPSKYIKGIKNWDTWIKQNGVYDEVTGDYKLVWDKDKLFTGDDNFEVGIVKSNSNAEGSTSILKLLFNLIVDTSETPEFVFGTAVKSSNASVSEQMPVAIRKAERKRKEYKKAYEALYSGVIQIASENGFTKMDTSLKARVKFQSILDEDLKLNLDIVKLLSEEGLITDRVKMLLLNMQLKVADIDEEIELAKGENEEKFNKQADQLELTAQSTAQANADQSKELENKPIKETKDILDYSDHILEQLTDQANSTLNKVVKEMKEENAKQIKDKLSDSEVIKLVSGSIDKKAK